MYCAAAASTTRQLPLHNSVSCSRSISGGSRLQQQLVCISNPDERQSRSTIFINQIVDDGAQRGCAAVAKAEIFTDRVAAGGRLAVKLFVLSS